MAIGRTEDRNTPGNPLGRRPRRDVWGSIRVTHLGPRSTWPHIKAGHMTAIDQTRPSCNKSLRSRGRPHKGFGCWSIAAVGACSEGRRPKAPQEGTREGRMGGCCLWGFYGAAVRVGDALAA